MRPCWTAMETNSNAVQWRYCKS